MRVWSIKVGRLFEGGVYFRHCLPSCGVYSRAAFNRGNVVLYIIIIVKTRAIEQTRKLASLGIIDNI